jgi:hypothetical protein
LFRCTRLCFSPLLLPSLPFDPLEGQQWSHDFLSLEPEDPQARVWRSGFLPAITSGQSSEDGRFVLWNTLGEKISVLKPED